MTKRVFVPPHSIMLSPVVVRLERRGGSVVQDCDVYIGRACNRGGWELPQSKWYNPFRVSPHRPVAQVVDQYREYLKAHPELTGALDELTGKVLGCWCKKKPEDPCHGDVLVELWRAQHPGYSVDPLLAKKHYHPIPKPKRKATPTTPSRSRKKFRTPETDPEGLRANKKLHPWPPLDLPEHATTIWADEAGWGSLAGPLYVCATYVGPGFDVQGLHDSKMLKPHERERLLPLIKNHPSLVYHLVEMDNQRFDALRPSGAWQQAMREAIAGVVEKVKVRFPEVELQEAIIDGNWSVLNAVLPTRTVSGGDGQFVGIAAASIIAKTERDAYMVSVADNYPAFTEIFRKGYGYSGNKLGHLEMLRKGIYTPLHRKTYNPLKTWLQNQEHDVIFRDVDGTLKRRLHTSPSHSQTSSCPIPP